MVYEADGDASSDSPEFRGLQAAGTDRQALHDSTALWRALLQLRTRSLPRQNQAQKTRERKNWRVSCLNKKKEKKKKKKKRLAMSSVTARFSLPSSRCRTPPATTTAIILNAIIIIIIINITLSIIIITLIILIVILLIALIALIPGSSASAVPGSFSCGVVGLGQEEHRESGG